MRKFQLTITKGDNDIVDIVFDGDMTYGEFQMFRGMFKKLFHNFKEDYNELWLSVKEKIMEKAKKYKDEEINDLDYVLGALSYWSIMTYLSLVVEDEIGEDVEKINNIIEILERKSDEIVNRIMMYIFLFALFMLFNIYDGRFENVNKRKDA